MIAVDFSYKLSVLRLVGPKYGTALVIEQEAI